MDVVPLVLLASCTGWLLGADTLLNAGVLDIASDCTITKADASAGLLFGIPHVLMANKPLSK
jgi:hypothetical protein